MISLALYPRDIHTRRYIFTLYTAIVHTYIYKYKCESFFLVWPWLYPMSNGYICDRNPPTHFMTMDNTETKREVHSCPYLYVHFNERTNGKRRNAESGYKTHDNTLCTLSVFRGWCNKLLLIFFSSLLKNYESKFLLMLQLYCFFFIHNV